MTRMLVKSAGTFLLAGALALSGCKGDKGPAGAAGANCTIGATTTDGTEIVCGGNSFNVQNGTPGTPGQSCTIQSQDATGTTVACPGGTFTFMNAPTPPAFYNVFGGTPASTQGGVALFHGQAFVTAQDELQGAPANPKFLANLAITGATADATGLATVTFTVKGKDNVTPVTGLTACSAGIFKLAPAGGGRNYNRWVPYIYRPGRTVNAGYRESTTSTPVAGTLVESVATPGTYTYTFGTNLSTAAFLVPAVPVTLVGYDRTLTHRVSIYMGGHAGPTGEADFDFVPDGSAITQTRDIVVTATCKKCHGPEFAGHGGDRVTVEGCNACHSPDGALVNSAANGGTTETIEMQVMIHKIHAGRELASSPGPDGIFFDDPATVVDESADNGTYTVGSLSATWRSAAFPAVLANCTVCHNGPGAQVDNWKTVPSRASCGSCHDLTTFVDGLVLATHTGGAQADDGGCAGCHSATKVVGYHDFSTKDIHNVPEFTIDVTTDTPVAGYYAKGQAPVITVVLKPTETIPALGYVAGTPIDHTTVIEDPSGEGCVANAAKTACTNDADGLFRSANMYVTGPRANRIPVLTTAARAKVSSATTGPWDLSAGGASLRVVVDEGNFVVQFGHIGEDVLVPGDFTVKLPAAGAALNALFANPAAATAAEVVAWLNGATAVFDYNEREFSFSDRAIAYVENGRVSIRTRAVGTFNPSVQIPAAATNLSGMFTDYGVKVAGSAVQLRQRTNPANNDPKFSWTAASLQYALDPVDDLVPGTYMINVEFADRGRPSVAADYRTPSVAVATFQVKQAAVETPIAGNCTSCHWSTDAVGAGAGYVLDPVRHNKPFNAQAVDQCGGCHNYKSGETVTAQTWTTGGGTKPIAKRVHAVHRGAGLNYPVLTVDHEESIPGRDWKITFPQDIRNCESCHPAATTNGTWATAPNRIACMGCHDSNAATAHMKLQVWDPTPTAPWSGDEAETCAACH